MMNKLVEEVARAVHLADNERYVLEWLAMNDGKQVPSSLDIFEHNNAVRSLRERGLVKRQRRPGWTCNVLTQAGVKTLAEIEDDG
jgi:hypothetical protein